MDIEKTYQKTNQVFNYRKPLQFTYHSRERMAEYGINDAWVENLWQKSHRTQLPLKYLSQKLRKYPSINSEVRYYYRNGYLLTTGLKHGNPVLITITKKYSGNLKIK